MPLCIRNRYCAYLVTVLFIGMLQAIHEGCCASQYVEDIQMTEPTELNSPQAAYFVDRGCFAAFDICFIDDGRGRRRSSRDISLLQVQDMS